MTTTGSIRLSTCDIRSTITTLRTLIRTHIHWPRRCTVTAIHCDHCRRWTPPRRYYPRIRACHTCGADVAAQLRQAIRSRTR